MMNEVVIIGLGYIGLPTAALIACNKTKVFGVDINPIVVDTINRGEIHIVEPELDEAVKKSVQDGYLTAQLKAEKGDVYLIVVPTPFKKNHEPDISYVESATKSIIPLLKKGDLYIIESTSPIGTTEKMRDLIFSIRPELKDQIYLAYCPERVLPGNVMHELVHNDRVIGGINEESTNQAANFYRKFVEGALHPTDSKTAEMCKLVENSSRDIQIAFANELSLICDKAGADPWKLIELANKHPRVNILQPGCGGGGHCIAVDPYFIVSEYPNEAKMISLGREINNYKPQWIVERIEKIKKQNDQHNNCKSKIAIMGLSFKPDIDDLRESPAVYISEKLIESFGVNEIMFVEPNLDSHDKFELIEYDVAVQQADIIVYLVKHRLFREKIMPDDKIILNYCGI